jgi:hypothetical protein
MYQEIAVRIIKCNNPPRSGKGFPMVEIFSDEIKLQIGIPLITPELMNTNLEMILLQI